MDTSRFAIAGKWYTKVNECFCWFAFRMERDARTRQRESDIFPKDETVNTLGAISFVEVGR